MSRRNVTTIRDYANLMLTLAELTRRNTERFSRAKQALARRGPARYPGVTVYRVGPTRVRAHHRSGYTAVRITG